jgi:predicted TIM-barrel fold metal-dependent hydrolase
LITMLHPNMPSIHDREDAQVPVGLPAVIDAHVHIFPRNIFSAVWQWFDRNGWRVRYRLPSSEAIDFLLSHGVCHIVALQYAHKPGIATALNNYMVDKCNEYEGRITGMATVYPGEEDARMIVREAFDSGLGGLKLHAHVQCFDMNGDDMNSLYDCCIEYGRPVVMHVGKEPKSAVYSCDPYEICSAEKLELVLRDFPDLKICVPHLGLGETSSYRRLIEKYDNLWLDTTMAVAQYFPVEDDIDLRGYRPDRVMYGSDFPNIPYAWDRELKILKNAEISVEALAAITSKNAADFFSIDC